MWLEKYTLRYTFGIVSTRALDLECTLSFPFFEVSTEKETFGKTRANVSISLLTSSTVREALEWDRLRIGSFPNMSICTCIQETWTDGRYRMHLARRPLSLETPFATG